MRELMHGLLALACATAIFTLITIDILQEGLR
ncbi:hypothetical protein [Stappia phage SI01]|uniref:Uncharacterized protein n=1 Tax=Stappia phage SI01 TaxID=2847766 RepID=A0AAE7SQN7_9CAUD|nr:hypothetical protein [Stappia phage SI01]